MTFFIADDGEVFEIPDLPEDLGRACALASEATLRKFWDTPEEALYEFRDAATAPFSRR